MEKKIDVSQVIVNKEERERFLQRMQLLYHDICPECGGDLTPKSSPHGYAPFVKCSNFVEKRCNYVTMGDYIFAKKHYKPKPAPKKHKDFLFEASVEAMLCAIELHNKPLLYYKYQATTALVVNAWELLLKAVVTQQEGIEKVVYKAGGKSVDKEMTITIIDALNRVHAYNPKKYEALKHSVEAVNELRNSIMHFYVDANEDLEVIYYCLLAKSVEFYINTANDFGFNSAFEKFIVLPLTTKMPQSSFKLVGDLLNAKETSENIKAFLQKIVDGSKESAIMFDFDVKLQSVKNNPISELKVAIDDAASARVGIDKNYSITDAKGSHKISISVDDFHNMYPYVSSQIMALTKDAQGDTIKGAYNVVLEEKRRFQQLLKDGNEQYCNRMKANKALKSQPPIQYSQKAYDEILGKVRVLVEKKAEVLQEDSDVVKSIEIINDGK